MSSFFVKEVMREVLDEAICSHLWAVTPNRESDSGKARTHFEICVWVSRLKYGNSDKAVDIHDSVASYELFSNLDTKINFPLDPKKAPKKSWDLTPYADALFECIWDELVLDKKPLEVASE